MLGILPTSFYGLNRVGKNATGISKVIFPSLSIQGGGPNSNIRSNDFSELVEHFQHLHSAKEW